MLQKGCVLQDATMDVVARAHDTKDDPFLESDACMFEKTIYAFRAEMFPRRIFEW